MKRPTRVLRPLAAAALLCAMLTGCWRADMPASEELTPIPSDAGLL